MLRLGSCLTRRSVSTVRALSAASCFTGFKSTSQLINLSQQRSFTSSSSGDEKVSYPTAGGGYLQTGHRDALAKKSRRFLVTGAVGQLGSEMCGALAREYGEENVIASDVKRPQVEMPLQFIYLDVMNMDQLSRVVLEYQIDTVIHFAAILSALGEQSPQLAIKLNTRGIENILEVARNNNLQVFAPSSIAVFGPSTPQPTAEEGGTPDDTIMRPTTVYGLTKLYLEHLGEYYYQKYGVDFRSIRYPGIISSEVMPGGGTTDYAVEIYRDALLKNHYRCFLKPDSTLPMMHMEDCIRSTMMLLAADNKNLSRRVYNVQGISFNPEQQVQVIQDLMPGFTVEYVPDFRQAIADTWPKALNDDYARKDWGWKQKHDLTSMSVLMLKRLREVLLDGKGPKKNKNKFIKPPTV